MSPYRPGSSSMRNCLMINRNRVSLLTSRFLWVICPLVLTVLRLLDCLRLLEMLRWLRSAAYTTYSTMVDFQVIEEDIKIWRTKKIIKSLEAARSLGNNTSMFSLIMQPGDQISWVTERLGEDIETASVIECSVNRQSVLGAYTRARKRLQLYNKVPPNGLVIYTGTIVTEDGKEKEVTIDFEPFWPIKRSFRSRDNKFHTEALSGLLESGGKFGFIIMDGSGTLFGTLSRNSREVLHKFDGRGGQSALSFGDLRMEKWYEYMYRTGVLAEQLYIKHNVSGVILAVAGSADFKTELIEFMGWFYPCLHILKVVEVSYGGENGFNEAIKLSAEILGDNKFTQEIRLIGNYFEELSQDTGKYVCGVEDTLKALEKGAVDTLIVWEDLDITRYTLKNIATGEEFIKHLNKEQEGDQNNFRDSTTNAVLAVQGKTSLLEWLLERFAVEYRKFGCTLEFVTNKSQEGSQFCRGFGGIGGILRYELSDDEVSDDEVQANEEKDLHQARVIEDDAAPVFF